MKTQLNHDLLGEDFRLLQFVPDWFVRLTRVKTCHEHEDYYDYDELADW